MIAGSPEHAIALLDETFNTGDLGAALRSDKNLAVVIPQPGTEARDITEIKTL